MSEQNLLSIGAILAAFLGTISLYLVSKNSELRWNEKIAGFAISWIFIAKAVSNSHFSVLRSIFDTLQGPILESETMWQYWWANGHMTDYVFTAGQTLLCLVFPVAVLRTNRQLKIAISALLLLLMYWPIVYSSLGPHWLEFAGFVYFFPCLVWTSVYVRFRLIQINEDDDDARKVADICVLLLLVLNGHIWFYWVGMFAQHDYFYFVDIAGSWSEAGSLHEYIWQMFYTLVIATGLFIVGMEIYILQRTGSIGNVGIIVCIYMAIGIIGFFVLSMGDADEAFALGADTRFKDMWKIFTNQTHFTIARPLIASYILISLGLVDLSSERNMRISKGLAVILIVVATAALLEMVQFVIPVSQVLSAGLLGIVVAIGIGWEERTFVKIVDSRVSLDELLGGTGWEAPDLEISERAFKSANIAMFVYFLILILLSYIIHISDNFINTL
jgi:hypothetical protein